MKDLVRLAFLTLMALALPAIPGGLSSAGEAGGTTDLAMEEAALPPVAPKHPKDLTIHGDTRVDDYYWLREKGSPEVVSYLEAENAYADAFMRGTEELQESLYQEILGRIKETDLTVPYRKGAHFYYSRTEEGKQYPIHMRRKGSPDGPEEAILDVNALAEGEKFMGVRVMEISDDGTLLAYTTDNTGFRTYTLHVRDLKTGRDLADRAEKVKSVAWAADGKTLFYTVDDETKRPWRLYRHRIGGGEPELIYEEPDERFRVFVVRSRSGEFIFLVSASHTTTEVRYLRAATPGGEFKVIAPREQDHEYMVDHGGDTFYILTNDTGRNFRLVTAPVSDPGRGSWKEAIPHSDEVMLEGIQVFAGHHVIREREGGLRHLRVTDLATGKSHRIELPDPVYEVFPSDNEEFEAATYRFNYQSLVRPSTIFDYGMDDRKLTLMKETEVLGGYDREQYASERIWATAKDGVKVPISLVYRKGMKRDGKSRMLLRAYGSYGFPYPATFRSDRVSLLDRGFIVATAHIRGGGEMGKKWHDDGRMFNKMNTFTDFIACAEHLIAEKYTSSDRLAIEGGSAGGLLMGAVTNMRPGLFEVVLNHVPFVDVLTTMLDEDLPLTVGEFEEWGNPKIKEQYEYIKSYCPYTNLAPREYPTILVKTSYDDSQVMYWEPAKYVAKLRALNKSSNPVVFKINMAGGHGGSSGRYDKLREVAFDYAFLLTQLGVEEPGQAAEAAAGSAGATGR